MSNDLQEGTVQELRELNSLIYLRPSNASLIDKRTYKTYNFSNLEYSPGVNSQCIINAGGDYIWGPSSYIRLEYNKVGAGQLGTGNILNYLKRVHLTHRSGEVIEKIDDYNVLARIILAYMTSLEDYTKLRDMLAVPNAATPNVVNCIPLWLLLGVFKTDSQFIPGGFLAGAKLEIEFETDAIAFAGSGSIEKIRPTIVLDSAQVYDSVNKQILEQQSDVASSGLQFTYSTWFSSSNDYSSTAFNFDIQQSASITEVACACVRKVSNIAADLDSFDFENELTSYQYRLGSQYMPQKPIANSTTEYIEAYYNTLSAFQALPHQYMGVSANNSGCSVSAGTFDNNAVYATSLEKSPSGLALTGEPTSNSRILNFSGSKLSDNHRVNVFLQYVRVANIMGSNLVVDR